MLLLMLLALGLIPAASVADDARELTPVWSLDVTSGRPVVTRNRLYRHRRPFPLPAVYVTDIDHPVPPFSIPGDNGSVRHYPGGVSRFAVLPVSRHGLVTAPLEFIPLRQVAWASSTRIEILNLGKDPSKRSVARGVSRVNPLQIAGVEESDLVSWTTPWNPAPRHDAGILLTKDATILIVDGEVKLRMDKVGYFPAFAGSADRGAVCVFDSTVTFRGAPSRLVVFDFEGKTISTVSFPAGHGCTDPHTSNGGRWVMALQQGEKGGMLADHVLLVDVATSGVRVLPGIAGGYRHYSADERYMAEVQGGFGIVRLFDITRPDVPRLVSEGAVDGLLYSAAINGNGSLMAAVVISNITRTPSVFVFDRSLDVVATAPLDPNSYSRLAIVNDMLLVGLPGEGADPFRPSQHIDLYDLHSLR